MTWNHNEMLFRVMHVRVSRLLENFIIMKVSS